MENSIFGRLNEKHKYAAKSKNNNNNRQRQVLSCRTRH